MTHEQIIAEALKIDAAITASMPRGCPANLAERMGELRRAAHRLGVDLEGEIRQNRAVDAQATHRRLQDIERRMTRAQSMPSRTRAQATTKTARLGQLAMSRDALQAQLETA